MKKACRKARGFRTGSTRCRSSLRTISGDTGVLFIRAQNVADGSSGCARRAPDQVNKTGFESLRRPVLRWWPATEEIPAAATPTTTKKRGAQEQRRAANMSLSYSSATLRIWRQSLTQLHWKKARWVLPVIVSCRRCASFAAGCNGKNTRLPLSQHEKPRKSATRQWRSGGSL